MAGVAPPVPPQNPRIEYAETIANALRNIQFGPQLLGIRELMTSALGGGASAAANEREALMRREQMEIEAAIMESLRDIETADYGQQSHHASGDDDESDHG